MIEDHHTRTISFEEENAREMLKDWCEDSHFLQRAIFKGKLDGQESFTLINEHCNALWRNLQVRLAHIEKQLKAG